LMGDVDVPPRMSKSHPPPPPLSLPTSNPPSAVAAAGEATATTLTAAAKNNYDVNDPHCPQQRAPPLDMLVEDGQFDKE
jgi:hypothetical protein